MASIASNDCSESPSQDADSEASDTRSLGEDGWFNPMDRSKRPPAGGETMSPMETLQRGLKASLRNKRVTTTPSSSSGSNSSITKAKKRSTVSTDGSGSQEKPTITQQRNSCKRRKRGLTDEKRVERNAREQARSNRISEQFAELRELLQKAGMVVPKGTKGSVLSIVRDYILALEENRNKTETECQQLRQQITEMKEGKHGNQAAQAFQIVSNSNSMPALVGCGKEPSKTSFPSETMNDNHYRAAFEHSAIGMAIATLGGSFVDCNRLFCIMTKQDKEQLKSLSVFNLTAHDQLSYAFEQLSGLLNNPTSPDGASLVLRASIPNLGMRVSILDHSKDGMSFPGDCRQKRLLITLVASPDAVQGIAGNLYGLLNAAQAHMGAAPAPEQPTQGGNLPNKSESMEDPSAFYATG